MLESHEPTELDIEISLLSPKIRKVQIILKTVEICNLACPYCYYYESGDDAWKKRPKFIGLDVVDGLCEFLKKGISDCGIETVQVIFHGGEPTLQPLPEFQATCDKLKSELGELCNLGFGVQTNGTRLKADWIDAFARNNVAVGISIDGREAQHDKFRFHHNGRGSYREIVEGIARLKGDKTFEAEGMLSSLSVLDSTIDYQDAVSHLVDEVGLNDLGFLLPDCTWDQGIPNNAGAADYGKVLCDIFDVWAKRGDVNVREISSLLKKFQRTKARTSEGRASIEPLSSDKETIGNHIVVVQSDGTVSIDDSLMPIGKWRTEIKTLHLNEVSLSEHVNSEAHRTIYRALVNVADACRSCVWLSICGGGSLENRWSSERQFDNPSVFCDGLKLFFGHVVKWLYKNGYPREVIEQRLGAGWPPEDRGFLG